MDNVNIKINGVECLSMEKVRCVASEDTANFIEEFFDDNDYVTAHTSGSTGTPKEIKLLKSDMVASAGKTNAFFSVNSDSVLYLNLSPKYIAGKMMIVRTICAGASLYEETASNAPLTEYSGPDISLAAFVPSQLSYLVNNEHILRRIRNMIVGGGEISEKMKRRLSELEVNAYATYGMTETCSHIALAKIGGDNAPYIALPGVELSVDERNCLVAEVPHLSVGKVVTNDMIDLLDGNSFYWRGRYDNVINSGGIKIFPEEVEHKIAPLFSHLKFYISGCKSEKWGESAVIVFEYPSLPCGVLKTGNVQPLLVDKMKALLPAHSVPRKYIALHSFDYTPNGKLKRSKFTCNLESL